MCGIIVLVRSSSKQSSDVVQKSADWLQLVKNNAARGPDSQCTENVVFPGHLRENGHDDIAISFVASTLHLRGTTLVQQPHTSEKSVFCWNGEVFEGLDLETDRNDGEVLFSKLDGLEQPEDLFSIMSTIEGPLAFRYAFVYYERRTHRLFFARDPLGRRSLLVHRPTKDHPYFMLSSTSAGVKQAYDFEEVDCKFIYSLDVRRLFESENVLVSFDEAIVSKDRTSFHTSRPFAKLARVNRTVPDALERNSLSIPLSDEMNIAMDRFLEVLDASVRLQVQNIPQPSLHNGARIAVLFSGGIDSTMVAFLANRYIPLDEPIDLLNVAFENPRKLGSRHNSDLAKRKKNKKVDAIGPQSSNGGRSSTYNVPDRISGLEELEELRRLCPGRQWNFVEIDVDYAESSQAKEVVENIMLPNRTVMDLSLGLALYFAARGKGRIRNVSSDCCYPELYISPARVLLNGLGSDELLGGYGRHRSAFNTSGWEGLIDELQLELDRLPSRNLGRDDRVICCHGKEPRYPFLALSVVDVVADLPVHLKVDPRCEVGMGDKMLLRLVARKLGLEVASQRKKKAMQFGSHSARMEIGVGDRDGDKVLSLT